MKPKTNKSKRQRLVLIVPSNEGNDLVLQVLYESKSRLEQDLWKLVDSVMLRTKLFEMKLDDFFYIDFISAKRREYLMNKKSDAIDSGIFLFCGHTFHVSEFFDDEMQKIKIKVLTIDEWFSLGVSNGFSKG
jgi:hypothetical protein